MEDSLAFLFLGSRGIVVLAFVDSAKLGHKSKGCVEGCDICSRKNKPCVNLRILKAWYGHSAIVFPCSRKCHENDPITTCDTTLYGLFSNVNRLRLAFGRNPKGIW